jgi:predicted RNase H-like HicB family nuclease
MKQHFNAIITEETGDYVALNPETGIASQGDTVNQALANLREALLLYFEEVGDKEIAESLSHQSFLTTATL